MTTRGSYPRSALVDSGATLALANTNDSNHETAVRIHANLVTAHAQLFKTTYLVDETYTLILARMGYQFAIRFLDELRAGSVSIVRITPVDEEQAEELLRRHDDKRFSYTDATSFVVMERLNLEAAFTFDKNFTEYGRIRVLTP